VHRLIRATAVAATATLTAAGTTLLPAPATAETPPVLEASAALLPAEASDAAVGPDGTTYVVGTTYKISSLEHDGDGTKYEAFILAYAPDGTLRDSRYLGGTGNDYAHAVTTTPDGSVVVVGSTLSTDFPTTPGNAGTGDQGGEDGYVAVLSSDLSTITASALYGGGGTDIPAGVAVDGTGAVWVVGWSDSLSLPVTSGSTMTLGGKDGFVLAFDPGLATRQVSRRVGGGDFDDVAEVVGLPGGGAIFVGRTTSGVDFPAVGPGVGGSNAPLGPPGTLDAFAVRINGSGTLAWSTRLGTSAADEASSVALDPQGRPVIAGSTNSTSFPATALHGPQEAGVWHGFVTTLAASGDAVVQSTVLGGAGGNVRAEDVTVDPAGDLYVLASAKATVPLLHEIPTAGGDYDEYAVKLAADGARMSWATVLGSSLYERARTIVVDPFGTITAAGGTKEPAFPGAAPSPATVHQTPGLMHRLRSTPHLTSFTGPATTTERTPTFAIGVDLEGARTECRVDAGPWAACGPTTWTTPQLSLGTHHVEVRPSDFPGVYGAPVAATVTVVAPGTGASGTSADTTAPETSIAKHPKKRTGKAKARFSFRATEAGSTFTCKVDKRAWKACGPSYAVKVKPGKHRIRVRATDALGNTDATPAVFRWKRV
jgi:hypothetical protein